MALIIIIDDSLLSRTMIRRNLQGKGHTILEASDGKQGLEIARIQKPDCICLDMLLPEMNGTEVLQALKDEQLNIPTIMITADTQETTRQKCLSLGAIAVLHKPAKMIELEAALSQALGNN